MVPWNQFHGRKTKLSRERERERQGVQWCSHYGGSKEFQLIKDCTMNTHMLELVKDKLQQEKYSKNPTQKHCVKAHMKSYTNISKGENTTSQPVSPAGQFPDPIGDSIPTPFTAKLQPALSLSLCAQQFRVPWSSLQDLLTETSGQPFWTPS
jgi:hypothetical protein